MHTSFELSGELMQEEPGRKQQRRTHDGSSVSVDTTGDGSSKPGATAQDSLGQAKGTKGTSRQDFPTLLCGLLSLRQRKPKRPT